MHSRKADEPIRVGWYVHPTRLGGLENFLLRLASRLDPARVRLLALFGGEGEVVEAFTAAGIESRTFCFDNFGAGFKALCRTIETDRLDLIQTNMFTPLAALAASKVGVPHIWRVGGHAKVALRHMPEADGYSLLDMVSSHSASIVCNSDYVAEPLAGLPGPGPIVIRNGIPLAGDAAATFPDACLEERTLRSSDPPRICMFAHFDRQKRHEDFIRAAALVAPQFRGVRFLLFGATFGEASMEGYRDELRSLTVSLGLEDTVTIQRTRCADSELAQATLSVLPSVDESSSNAILEAMARGVPVIAADSGGHPEMIDHDRTGLLVPPNSPGELAVAIVELLRDRRRAERLAGGALETARKTYDIDACARRYEALYRECPPGA